MSEGSLSLDIPASFTLHAREEVGSTNDEVRLLAETGAQDRTVVWALRQSAGRGRQGRTWVSPEGNLYFSLLLRPEVAIAEAANLSFVAALALADAIKKINPEITPSLKWPNDVLVSSKKISGVLLESKSTASGALDFLIMGIGVNIRTYPGDARYPATSLLEQGGCDNLSPGDLLSAFLNSFDPWYKVWKKDGFMAIRSAWLDQAHGIGKTIYVRLPHQTLSGRFVTIDKDGALDLELDSGEQCLVTAGDVFFAS
ncbi:biotin--[acetyl-CoA-carboxylase] ligase [Kiloniella laminariae]|uniref:biotin--[biotin carboxyl-carrier protein] ligase n=1 Tax=Kiloniella laminariae TaxID=454162 RepID=A0ABT4LPY9_9PROT|nr:biotin--[acetyl-CoA-carboxylase] ligase [Kiloniella laminariae]MCZ4282012.1 biotin--[acetyl-CoA-carboxylase] ligase [Kiloniella laminariae]